MKRIKPGIEIPKRLYKACTRSLAGFILLAMIAVGSGCGGSAEGPDNSNGLGNLNDGRPEGTVLMLIPLSDSCDIRENTTGYLYDNYPLAGGKVVQTQKVVNRELRFYLPPDSGPWVLFLKNDSTELYNVTLFTSDRDVESPELVCQ